MTDPSASDPYGYFAGQPAPAQTPAEPGYGWPPLAGPTSWPPPAGPASWPPPTGPGSYLDPQERTLLAGAQLTAEHNMGYSPSFRPVGSRLGIGGAISTGFRLLPTCWAALMAEPALLLVPLAVLAVGVVAALGYAIPFGGISHLLSGSRGAVAVKTLPLTAVMCAVSVVGRAVVVADATQSMQGLKPRFGQAWTLTMSRLPALIGFGIAQAAQRTITGALRNSAAGRLAGDVLDRAWDFATFLAVPAILFDRIGPLAAVRRSGSLVASRWGTQLTAKAVLSFAVAACTIPLVILGVVLAASNPPAGITLIVAVLAAAIAVSSALSGILSAAMYRFATTGLLAPGFAEADMWSVFSRR